MDTTKKQQAARDLEIQSLQARWVKKNLPEMKKMPAVNDSPKPRTAGNHQERRLPAQLPGGRRLTLREIVRAFNRNT